MKTEDVIAALSGLDTDGVAMVAATCVGLIGQAQREDGTLAFETAVRTIGARGESERADLNSGGSAIYHAINDLDDDNFDFDVEDDDEG